MSFTDESWFVDPDDLPTRPPHLLQAYPDFPAQEAVNARANPDISPWTDPVAPSPAHAHGPPQPARRTTATPHRPLRPSMSSTASLRARPSDAHSFTSDYAPSVSDISIADLRKGKGSLSFLSDIIKKRSRSKLASSDSTNDSTATLPTFSPNPSQLTVNTFMTPFYHVPPPVPKKDRDRPQKRSRLNKPPPQKQEEPLLTIDTDFTHPEDFMDVGTRPRASSPDAVDASSLGFSPPSPPSIFTDPFRPASVSSKRSHRHDRKVSPKTIMQQLHDPDADQLTEREWTAPESWAIERDGLDAAADPASSSSEESIVASSSRTPDDSSIVTDMAARKRMRRKTHYTHKPTSSASSSKFVLVRIYRADGSYHVAQIPSHATVADLTPSLNGRVRCHDREIHKLYLKERGRGT
jgi:adenylate cyclase